MSNGLCLDPKLSDKGLRSRPLEKVLWRRLRGGVPTLVYFSFVDPVRSLLRRSVRCLAWSLKIGFQDPKYEGQPVTNEEFIILLTPTYLGLSRILGKVKIVRSSNTKFSCWTSPRTSYPGRVSPTGPSYILYVQGGGQERRFPSQSLPLYPTHKHVTPTKNRGCVRERDDVRKKKRNFLRRVGTSLQKK